LPRIPGHIRRKLLSWAKTVELEGILKVRKLPGFHDEPLQGKRFGQRSIRLSKGYRAIYTQEKDGHLHLIVVEEVSKHEY
jgi:toxin HigB-1